MAKTLGFAAAKAATMIASRQNCVVAEYRAVLTDASRLLVIFLTNMVTLFFAYITIVVIPS